MSPDALPWWEPDYSEADGQLRFTVSGCASNVCPVAFITGRSLALLEDYQRAHAMKDFGAPIGAVDDWPASLVDAFIVFNNEELKRQEARAVAAIARRSNGGQ